MRKSVNEKDPGYDPEAWKYKAFLNGEELSNCVTADDELNVVVVRHIIEGDNSFRFDYKVLNGEVKLCKSCVV